MKLKLLLALSCVFALFACSPAQSIDPEKAKDSTRILQNMRKVELMNQLLPLTLEKDQILQILPTLERIRDKVRKLYVQENADLQLFDKASQASVDDAMKGKMPDQDYVRKIVAFYRLNDVRRQVAVNENIDMLLPVLQKVCNKGQLKVMANSLTLAFFEPDVKPAEATDEFRQRVFIREVMLDPMTYDLLLQMSK